MLLYKDRWKKVYDLDHIGTGTNLTKVLLTLSCLYIMIITISCDGDL